MDQAFTGYARADEALADDHIAGHFQPGVKLLMDPVAGAELHFGDWQVDEQVQQVGKLARRLAHGDVDDLLQAFLVAHWSQLIGRGDRATGWNFVAGWHQAKPFEQREQLVVIQWFVDKGQGSELKDPLMGLGLDITRNHDDEDIQRFATDCLENLIAVETWHVQIQEQQLTFSCSQELQGFLTIAGAEYFVGEACRQPSNELLAGKARIITDYD